MAGIMDVGENAEPHVCVNCGTSEGLTFAPDPYSEDIDGDDTPVWECDACREERAMDI